MEQSAAGIAESSYTVRAYCPTPTRLTMMNILQRDIHYSSFLIRPLPQLERFHAAVCEMKHPFLQ